MSRRATISVVVFGIAVLVAVLVFGPEPREPVTVPKDRTAARQVVEPSIRDDLAGSRDLSIGDPEEELPPGLPSEPTPRLLTFLFLQSKEPAAGTRWNLRSRQEEGAEWSCTVSQGGSVSVPEGVWEILAEDPRFTTIPSIIHAEPNRRQVIWVLSITTLRVQVTDSALIPIERASVFFWPIVDRPHLSLPISISYSSSEEPTHEASTNAEGEAVLMNITPVGRVLALADGYEPMWVSVHGERGVTRSRSSWACKHGKTSASWSLPMVVAPSLGLDSLPPPLVTSGFNPTWLVDLTYPVGFPWTIIF